MWTWLPVKGAFFTKLFWRSSILSILKVLQVWGICKAPDLPWSRGKRQTSPPPTFKGKLQVQNKCSIFHLNKCKAKKQLTYTNDQRHTSSNLFFLQGSWLPCAVFCRTKKGAWYSPRQELANFFLDRWQIYEEYIMDYLFQALCLRAPFVTLKGKCSISARQVLMDVKASHDR